MSTWQAKSILRGDVITAVIRGDLEEMRSLLANPDFPSDTADSDPLIGLLIANHHARSFTMGCFKELIRDRRFSISHSTRYGASIFALVAECGNDELLKWSIAVRGAEIDAFEMTMASEGLGGLRLKSLADLVRDGLSDQPVSPRLQAILDLLELLKSDKESAIAQARREVGLDRLYAAEVFAMVVYLCDGYLMQSDAVELASPEQRFFSIVSQLPIELQMVLCRKAYALPGSIISHPEREAAFKAVARLMSRPL